MEDLEKWLRTVCFQSPTPEVYTLARAAWTEATMTEREACAKVCETGDIHEAQIAAEWLRNADTADEEVMTRLYCAAAIRERSNA